MINNNIKKIIYPAALIVCFVAVFGLGIWVGVNKIAYHVPQPGTIDFSLFWDAYNTLQENFINPDKIDNQKIIYGAIKGMAETLGDPYTDFFDPDQAKRFQQDLSGSFEGIGVEIGVKKDMLTIIAPLDGTPGQKAGLKPGDIIIKIDGKDASSMTTEEAVSLIRGPKGTSVTLTIFRDTWDKSKDIKIIRDTIKVESMKWKLINSTGEEDAEGDIAYIQINQFNESVSSDFRKAAIEILGSPAKKIIVDLRDDPGGYLEVAQDVAGWFLKKGQTVTIEDYGKDKEQETYKSEGSGIFANYPVVVLINEGSASASEILAGALRDNNGTKLIGDKSFGKGSVQRVIDLKGGSFLKITIAKWLTPKGNSISEVGLEPDIKISNEIGQATDEGKDPQMDKALEIIKDLK